MGLFSSMKGGVLKRRAQELTGAAAAPAQKAAEKGRKPKRRLSEAFPFISERLSKMAWVRKYELKLIAAGIPLRASEFALIVLVSIVFLGSIGAVVFKSPLIAILLAVAGYYVPNWYLEHSYEHRRLTMESQLADSLSVISAAINAGYSFIQSADMVSRQMPPPISDELKRVVRLSAMGMPVEQALQQMADRAQSYDFAITASAVTIQLRRGGNLSRLLETISDTIRQRVELRGEIAAATALARLSGMVLVLLPPVVGSIMLMINREYAGFLINNPTGKKFLYLAFGMQAVGIMWIRKLMRIDL